MANGFIDGVGYPMNGGMAAGFAYGQKMAEEKRRRGLASGFANYVNAEDEAGKKAALAQIAQNDPETAVKLRNQTNAGWTTDLGRAMALRNSDDPVVRAWAIRYTDNLAKNPYITYQNAYGQQVGKQDAEAGIEPTYGYGTPVYNQPVVEQPMQGGDALANVPVREKPIQGEQPQAMPMQAQPMPRGRVTAASLAADKKRAEKKAEGEETFLKDSAQADARIASYDNLIQDVKANEDILGPVNAINFKAGEWTNGLFGLGSEDRQKYSSIRRQIGEMRSRLIARAKAAGQSGINTAREIELATAGIDFDMTAPSLIGAIEELKRNEIALNEAIAQHYGVGGKNSQPQEEVVSFEDWMK